MYTPVPQIVLYAQPGSEEQKAWPTLYHQGGQNLDLSHIRTAIKPLLAELDVDKQCYSIHKFRISVGMSASLSNILGTHMQLLGQWQNNAFQRYINPLPVKQDSL